MPIKAYYCATVPSFLKDDADRILGVLTTAHHHSLEEPQRWAWHQQIPILKEALGARPDGRIFLEFYIPRMGKRADALLIAENIVFVIEFKAGATTHESFAFDQVEDYALDLKNFHEGSHNVPIVPVLVSTNAETQPLPELKFAEDLVAAPGLSSKSPQEPRGPGRKAPAVRVVNDRSRREDNGRALDFLVPWFEGRSLCRYSLPQSELESGIMYGLPTTHPKCAGEVCRRMISSTSAA
jgi:hypothetical protein